MTDTDTGPRGPGTVTWDITYANGTHRVTTRPGDFVRARRTYPNWQAMAAEEGAEAMMYLAWLASRHDLEAGLARPDFDAFLDDAVTIQIVTGSEAAAVPTVAAPGNGSLSSSLLPPARHPLHGSMPTPTPS